MKIRTRLLLFFLPTLVASISFVSTLLAYNWYKEIEDGFKTRLKTAVMTTAAMIDPQKFREETKLSLTDEFSFVQKELKITKLYFVPLNSPLLSSIPKDFHVTGVYKSSLDQKKAITGYAPIFDQFGHITGLVAADIDVDLINQKFQESLFLIIAISGLTILLTIATLFFIANKISKPVQKLNNSALAIAAGEYGGSIEVKKGPKEIVELANTLNTMSECLLENINRLKENSLLRERMYGEYECSMLLQHLMLQKNIENCTSDLIAVKPVTLFSENPKGFLLDFPKTEKEHLFEIHLAEAEEEGFEGMYQLLTQYKYAKDSKTLTSLILDKDKSTLSFKGPHLPYLWSLQEKRFILLGEKPQKVESGDYFFLFNRGFSRFYENTQKIADFLTKVLRAFAHEELETVSFMLQKELTFASKRKALEEDLHLLAFQVLNL